MLDGDSIFIELSREVGIVLRLGLCKFIAEHGSVGAPVRCFQAFTELVNSVEGVDEW